MGYFALESARKNQFEKNKKRSIMSLDRYSATLIYRSTAMFLFQNRRTLFFWFFTICSAVPDAHANIITIYNHTRYPVYAAAYYVGINWFNQSVGPASRQGEQVCIAPQSSARIERPKLYPMFHREVLFSVSSMGLTQAIGAQVYRDTPRHGIGWRFDTVYHIAELENALTCYDSIGWVVDRPIIEDYERVMDALFVRLRAQYRQHPYNKRSAQVVPGSQLSGDEERAIAIRMAIVTHALERVLQKKIEPASVFSSGLGFSGGGMGLPCLPMVL